MKIYLDLLLIQDTIVISIIIYIMCKIIPIKIGIVRVLIISLLTNLISIFFLIFFPTIYSSLLLRIVAAFIIVKYGLKTRKALIVIERTLLIICLAVLVGGAYIFCNCNIVITILLYIIIEIVFLLFQKTKKHQLLLNETTCTINFNMDGKQYTLKALIDSGHDVKTIYNEQVIFVRNDLLEEGGEVSDRIIKYKTLSGLELKSGIKIKNVNVKYYQEQFIADAVLVKTSNIKDCYDAIVGIEMLTEGRCDL